MKINSKKTFVKRVIIVFLMIFWLVSIVNYLKSEDFTLTTLDGRYGTDKLEFSRVYEMHKGDFITGTFKSKYPNLGIISIRFNTHSRINDDVLIFKLKETNSNDWYYQANYKTDQFQNGKLFPFGFPPIKDSKNKTYYFEIISTNGELENSVALDGNFPSFVSKHSFPKETLMESKRDIVNFMYLKITSIISDQGILIHTFIFFLPLLYFLLFQWFGYSPMIPLTVVMISILIDFAYPRQSHPVFPAAIALGLILPIYKFNIISHFSAFIGLCFLAITPLIWSIKFDIYAEKTAIWAFLFLSIASIQQVIETYKKPKSQLHPLVFWKKLRMEYMNTIKFIHYVANGQIVITTGMVNDLAEGPDYDSRKLVALIIYRLGIPMAKTYLTTTRFVATIIIVIVKLLKFTYKYGPYILSVWLIWLNIRKIHGYYLFYQDFYISNQKEIFWMGTGKYLVPLIIFTLIIFLILQKGKKLREKALIAILILFVFFKASAYTFDATTRYKYDIIIWSASPRRATLWDNVKLTGRNFRNLPFKGKVYIDGIEHMVLSWSDRLIVFQADPTKTKTGEIKVVDYYGKESGTFHLDYYDLQTGELIK